MRADKINLLVAALSLALAAGDRPPALWSLPPIKYPVRQLHVTELEQGTYEARYYYRYKDRRPKSKVVPINVAAVRDALNAVLISSGILVTAVEDCDQCIKLIMKEI